MQKEAQSGNQISPKEKQKRCNVFCFKMEAMIHRNLRPEKSVKKVEKSNFSQKIDIRVRRIQLYLWE